MLTRRVAFVDTTNQVPFPELAKVAAAINLQVHRDFAPIWHVKATVSAVHAVDALPVGVWPIFLVDNLPPGEGGVHLTKHNQPYAFVELGDGWRIAASHECLEMLVDPSGNLTYASNAIAAGPSGFHDVPGKFQYLVEVCDPSEDDPFAYSIDDVTVSDFYTPAFFDPQHAAGTRYSFTDAIKHPREVKKNGYLSWFNPTTGTLQQARFFKSPEIVDLSKPKIGKSLREHVDNESRPTLKLSKLKVDQSTRLAETVQRAEILSRASKATANEIYAEILKR